MFSQENVNSRMYTIGKNTLLLSRLLTIREVIEKIDKVAMDDIRKASERITDMKSYSAVLICNKHYDLKYSMENSII